MGNFAEHLVGSVGDKEVLMENFVKHLVDSVGDEKVLVGNFVEHLAGGVEIPVVGTKSEIGCE